MFGWGYVKDFCISLFQNEQKQKAVEIYFAENLRIIGENTAKAVMLLSGGKCEASYIQVNLADLLDPKPVEKRTATEIIGGIKDKINKIK